MTDNIPENVNNSPKTLYRFRGVNKLTFDEMLNRYLFFSLPSNFNDPFEFFFDRSCIPSVAQELAGQIVETEKLTLTKEQFLIMKNKWETELIDFFDVKKNTLYAKGVCCFSGKNNNALQWSHYADGHKGICIEYDVSRFEGKIHKAIYSETPTKIHLLNGEIDTTRLLRDFICTKRSEWSYENEFRIINGEGSKRLHLGRDAIVAVYFGLKTPQDEANAIARAVLTNNKNARWYWMRTEGDTWNLTCKEVSFSPEPE